VNPGGWTATELACAEKEKIRVGLCAIGATLPEGAVKVLPWTRAIVASAVLWLKAARLKGGGIGPGAGKMNMSGYLGLREVVCTQPAKLIYSGLSSKGARQNDYHYAYYACTKRSSNRVHRTTATYFDHELRLRTPLCPSTKYT
jgi:hypothetical protein